jgi:hypothetical protein
MQPIKFVKVKDNLYDYEVMTLVNIISHRKKIMYYFIAEYHSIINGVLMTKDLIEISEEDYDEHINLNYKII